MRPKRFARAIWFASLCGASLQAVFLLLKKNEIRVSSTEKSPASTIFGLEIELDVDFGA